MPYVSMTDKFMSTDKPSIFLVECHTQEQAETVARNAHSLKDMRKVNIHEKRPHYPANTYRVLTRHYNDLGPRWKQ